MHYAARLDLATEIYAEDPTPYAAWMLTRSLAQARLHDVDESLLAETIGGFEEFALDFYAAALEGAQEVDAAGSVERFVGIADYVPDEWENRAEELLLLCFESLAAHDWMVDTLLESDEAFATLGPALDALGTRIAAMTDRIRDNAEFFEVGRDYYDELLKAANTDFLTTSYHVMPDLPEAHLLSESGQEDVQRHPRLHRFRPDENKSRFLRPRRVVFACITLAAAATIVLVAWLPGTNPPLPSNGLRLLAYAPPSNHAERRRFDPPIDLVTELPAIPRTARLPGSIWHFAPTPTDNRSIVVADYGGEVSILPLHDLAQAGWEFIVPASDSFAVGIVHASLPEIERAGVLSELRFASAADTGWPINYAAAIANGSARTFDLDTVRGTGDPVTLPSKANAMREILERADIGFSAVFVPTLTDTPVTQVPGRGLIAELNPPVFTLEPGRPELRHDPIQRGTQLELWTKSLHPGMYRYFVYIGGDGVPTITESTSGGSDIKLPLAVTEPPPSMTIIMFLTNRPLSAPDRERMAAQLAGDVETTPDLPRDIRLIWRTGGICYRERLDGTGDAPQELPDWCRGVRKALSTRPYYGLTLPVIE